MAIEIFRRREQKYLITHDQYQELVKRMMPFMRPDRNGSAGQYTITTLYFESPDNRIYFETKNKLRFRQKLRLRIYDDTNLDGNAFFEIKQKHKKVVNKRRMVLPLSEAYRYLSGETPESLEDYMTSNLQVFREIDHYRTLYELRPEMVVSYDRHALHHIEDPDLRVTFDLNLRCRNHDLQIEHGPFGEHFIAQNLVVLEVKVSHSIPLWLTRILQDLRCEQRSASKFCTSLECLKGEELPNGIEQEKILVDAI
ncbi:transporter [Bacillus sp. J14TS2]|uniref:polyphosphate polymerase domain-containing protein n=1 Tax=Bacillus sp. J14TS2 TaxID=2807188 RepID=UPI001B2E823C|nr:polyphosphate polymerase domain-containing protein [Bacillus sp. J14TS2]GIN70576.1 transporter [Bacillus sp. J14TS2]